MAVFAHPDDEGQIAGMLARYASQGIETALLCATRGELGSTGDPSLLAGRSMAQVREEELQCVRRILGVKELHFLGYQEGLFHRADPDQVIEKIREAIARFTPQVVITFGPEGVYGHRDHVAISRLTTAAFHASREKNLSRGLEFPLKLYYTAFPRSLFERLRRRGIEFKIDIEGAIRRIDGVPDEEITTIIDVTDFRDRKIEAFRCHRSQLRPGDFRWIIMEGKLRELLATERLVRVFPPVKGTWEKERGLFEAPDGLASGSGGSRSLKGF
ncbi:MAG: PIG-L family deacetylase [Deltaproteobacteria bacterium]|nr:PIG-L family deacetylase [Deltaproteobacteria bacterium]